MFHDGIADVQAFAMPAMNLTRATWVAGV